MRTTPPCRSAGCPNGSPISGRHSVTGTPRRQQRQPAKQATHLRVRPGSHRYRNLAVVRGRRSSNLFRGVLASTGLAIMASGGLYGNDGSGSTVFWIQNYLLAAILWLLLGIPHRAFKYRLDLTGEGTVRELMLGSLAGLVSALAGILILVSHFDRGPLAQVNAKTLIVGVIFTSFLIYPVFKAIARACWQRGVTGIFSPRSLFEKWRQAALELAGSTGSPARRS
jgi:hypothetical protein